MIQLSWVHLSPNKLASSKLRFRVRNYDSLNYSLTGVKCRATSVAKNKLAKLQATLVRNYDLPTDRLTDGGEV